VLYKLNIAYLGGKSIIRECMIKIVMEIEPEKFDEAMRI